MNDDLIIDLDGCTIKTLMKRSHFSWEVQIGYLRQEVYSRKRLWKLNRRCSSLSRRSGEQIRWSVERDARRQELRLPHQWVDGLRIDLRENASLGHTGSRQVAQTGWENVSQQGQDSSPRVLWPALHRGPIRNRWDFGGTLEYSRHKQKHPLRYGLSGCQNRKRSRKYRCNIRSGH